MISRQPGDGRHRHPTAANHPAPRVVRDGSLASGRSLAERIGHLYLTAELAASFALIPDMPSLANCSESNSGRVRVRRLVLPEGAHSRALSGRDRM